MGVNGAGETLPDLQGDVEAIKVELGARSYDILIGSGLVAGAGQHVANLFPNSRCAIVSDSSVYELHGRVLESSLDAAELEYEAVIVSPGEPSKSLATLENVVEAVIACGMERGDVVIAFGGGVVGDLAGFAAGIIRRGMGFVQIPTSLLAQVDSSVGGKTGINSPHGKNLIGLFNQPQVVLADTGILDTLSDREMRAGYAEVAKYGLIDRPEFFAWLEQNHREIFVGGPARRQAIAESCRAKAAVVKADELENGSRALLNLGHTFGHALEAGVGYDSNRLVHGEGVAIGMVLAHEFSCRMNHCGPDVADRVRAHLAEVGLPTSIHQIDGHGFTPEGLMAAIAQDKKVQRGALTFILSRGVGEAFIAQDVPPSEVRAFLDEKLKPT